MACCLTVPSHYLNQCWLIIGEVLWNSPEHNFTKNPQTTCPWYEFENYQFKITPTSPRGQWVILGQFQIIHHSISFHNFNWIWTFWRLQIILLALFDDTILLLYNISLHNCSNTFQPNKLFINTDTASMRSDPLYVDRCCDIMMEYSCSMHFKRLTVTNVTDIDFQYFVKFPLKTNHISLINVQN